MTTTIDTTKIKNLVVMTGRVTIIPLDNLTCGERNEHIDFILKYDSLEMQIVCRDQVGREVIDMKLKKGEKVSVIGYLENDGDIIIIADKVERVK